MKKFGANVIDDLILELEKSKIKKIVGVYGGRFQPFGPHHKKVYEWLKSKFDDAYITTSNIKQLPRHPMNFAEKVRHMKKMGIPSNKIVMERTPFVAKSLQSKFNPETTAFVYIFGAKDTGRLGGGKYFQDFKKNKNNLKGFEEHGYYLVAPHMSVSAGGLEVSGTSMRNLLGSPKYKDQREKLFKKMFGYYDKGLFNMMTNKFSKLFEISEDWFKKGSKKDRELKLKISKLYSKAFKHMPGSPAQEKIKKEIEKLRNQLSEAVTLPVSVGDTIMMGRFKNKKVKVKSIDVNEKGDLLINGRPATKFRIYQKGDSEEKGIEHYDDDIKITKEQIEHFLIKYDIGEIIKEASATGVGTTAPPDSGPGAYFKEFGAYKIDSINMAARLGMEVMRYGLGGGKDDEDDYPIYNINSKGKTAADGPPPAVTWFPAGMGGKATANNQIDLWGSKAWNAWIKHMNPIAAQVGFKLVDELEYGDFDWGEDEIKKDSMFGSRETKKVMDKEEPPDTPPKVKKQKVKDIEESFTKNWWGKELLKEELVTKNRLQPRKKELLLMGGAYGHMAHPFDDKDLTFGDLKTIITMGLGGTLNREDGVTEKLDGQNIMVSWKDGKLIAARNKGHIKNGGKTALDAKGIRLKFAGRGDIANAFNFAMTDLGKAIGSLSEKQRTKIFNNGYNFMNLEVMWPKSANVIDYDVATLVFHGALIYDDNGTVKGEVPGSGRILAGMIKQVNQHIQSKYSIGKPNFLTVPKHQDFGKLKDKFLSSLARYQSKFGLGDGDTLGLYHQKWWEQFITKKSKGKITGNTLKGLVKRWAFFDKSYAIPMIKKDLDGHPEFLDWVLTYDKENHAKQVKENMKPFEILFFEVGAEIMKNISGFIAANPNKAVQGIKKKLDSAISNVKSGGDLKKLNTLKVQLDRLNAIGGMKAIVPSEGIVFKYKGKTYKFTGAFAPINQITGLISF